MISTIADYLQYCLVRAEGGHRPAGPLYLGVKNIHLGPTLPAFLSENVAKVLVENFNIAGIGTVEEDMQLFFGEER